MRQLVFLIFLFVVVGCDMPEMFQYKIQYKVQNSNLKGHFMVDRTFSPDPYLSDFDIPAPRTKDMGKDLNLFATQYYIYHAKDGGSIPLLDRYEKPLGYSLDLCDWCLGAIEGTIYLEDKKGKVVVLNNVGSSKRRQVKCQQCPDLQNYKNVDVERTLWKISEGYGDGVNGYKLIPFRSIAVDEKKIPFGSVIYIPSIRGKSFKLPNGHTSIHDGYFFAADKGSAIKNFHIDVFTGITNENPFPETITSDPKGIFKAHIIKDKLVVRKLLELHLGS